MATDFTNSFRQLQKSYPGLSKRFWKICGAPIYSVMQSPAPSQPAVILIAIPPERYRQGEEIAHQLSKIYPGKAEPVYINSTHYNSTDPDSAKLDIDTMLNDGFGKGSKAAVLYRLEEIPPPAMLIFYKYCDNENAPYKDAVIIFTVNLPEPISEDLNNQEQEKAVQEFLRSKWEGRADLDIDKIGALFSRIANSVAIMNTEYNPNPMI
ncbi:torsin-1A-interacting protein 1-like [Ptychodera flava]|uniref:torsin-1A-interacting protein 1-like n=1 Tax=Ptychodera flava TaxID=63121 RepID=UPI00396A6C17